ncbi:MAG: tRNA (adenosine(37)-N6)-threonylcarbamoyltransferase complex dimerization subunit type 1 TsaB [Magnetococcales bacterium]|nr:tRNA (adenosine(37)-N6)-threonylcarbamoyltransferase complex dimerization subunit type 1 TsaB [Magnetococcales bacterium]
MRERTLAVDGSGPEGGVALLEEDRIVEEVRFAEGSGFGVTLPTEVATLLERHGCSFADLGLLAVTLGPGSFTGLRIALGLAKGIALVHSLPIAGISTLELAATATGLTHGLVLSLKDAGGSLLFHALYRRDGDRLDCVLPPAMGSIEALVPSLLAATFFDEPVFCCGPGLDGCRIPLQAALGPRFLMPETPFVQPGPGLLGCRGLHHACPTRYPGSLELEPLYLRPPQAVMNH